VTSRRARIGRRVALACSLAAVLAVAGCNDPPRTAAPDASPGDPSNASSASPPSSAPPPDASPPASPPAPIDAALPALTAAAPPALDRRAECAKETCTLAHLVPDEVRPALSDGAPLVVWEQAIGERAAVVFPRDEAVEVMGVVLDGTLDLTPMEAPTARTVGGRWAGFRAPGGGVTLGGTGGKAARVALVIAVTEAGVGLGAHLDRRDRPGAPPSWSWKVRRKRVDTFSFTDRPDVSWGGGAYHARIGWEASKYRLGEGGQGRNVDDQPAAVVDLLHFSADADLAEHGHEQSWETLVVLEGDGAVTRKGASGDERTPARPGSIFTFPRAARHAWKPSGKAPFLAIQVLAPPGPEQRFKKLAGKPL
jgi:mannose-6-phosphate isomerase-like protein (cupin superfamily)